jgi:hypothetical protein
LLARIEHLRAAKEAGNPSIGVHGNLRESLNHGVAGTARPDREPSPRATEVADAFETHVWLPDAAGKSRFFGASSVFALTVEVLRHAVVKSLMTSDELSHPTTPGLRNSERNTLLCADRDLGDQAMVRSLFRLYFSSSNVLYGILDEESTRNDLEEFLATHAEDRSIWGVGGNGAQRFFRIYMLCAIAAATQARYRSSRDVLAMSFYQKAVPWIEEVTAEVSPASLQALLLLTIFCLFYPRNGDIWKLLDYSCRLCVELGYHTEPMTSTETEAQRRLRRSTFWGLYAMERIVGQLFGRPSDLPEPIITTEYPCIVETTGQDFTQSSFQPVSIAHHYRIVYLRSEIFRDIYMPARPIQRDFDWYHERYRTLFAWRQELQSTDDLAGVATITCDVAYHSSICFLFQPLMLQALRRTSNVDSSSTALGSLPQDNYWSACALIETYEKVMQAPENSALGEYPITFLSAHYIYLAGMTLMAHAVLAIDGRVNAYQKLADCTTSLLENDKIDFTSFWQTHNSCMFLLCACAERWPGMDGMLNVYKTLADKCLPVMMRRMLLS